MTEIQSEVGDQVGTRVSTYPMDFMGVGGRYVTTVTRPLPNGAREAVAEYVTPSFSEKKARALHQEIVLRYRQYGGRPFRPLLLPDGRYCCPICDQPTDVNGCDVSVVDEPPPAVFGVSTYCGKYTKPAEAMRRLELWRDWIKAEEAVQVVLDLRGFAKE